MTIALSTNFAQTLSNARVYKCKNITDESEVHKRPLLIISHAHAVTGVACSDPNVIFIC